ncbi:19219_t:CDS:2 [Funneliformis geosporum]|nr:19219_t:CDS:2 [Funneliformis geosporum]
MTTNSNIINNLKRATCNNCELYWKHRKPYILHEYLANFCKKYPKEISLYYASIIGKDKGKQDIEVEYISSKSNEPPIKKSKQTAMFNFFEPKN